MLPELRYMNGEERNSQMLMVIQDSLAEETDEIANLATVAAYMYAFMERVNWVGFYFVKGDTLIVGPYQGQPACVRIPMGKGVCGTCAEQRSAVTVDEVGKFPGYISCDISTRSEIAVPVYKNGELFAVLDIDSPEPARFSAADKITVTEASRLVGACLDRAEATKVALEAVV
ncbi:MAG: GAF domain-containing protein [Oscillospiraceae bacterium]|nr:GAF domain-containing protein [Oscillospiraceae bacterium]